MKNLLKKLRNILFIVPLFLWYWYIGCPLKWLTGITCAGCGMSRAVLAALKGDFTAAFSFHPLVIMLPIIAVILIFYNRIGKKSRLFFLIMFAITFTTVYFYRLSTGDSIVAIHLENGAVYALFHRFFN